MIHDERRIGGITERRSKGEGPCPEARGSSVGRTGKADQATAGGRKSPQMRDYREVEKRKSLRIRTGVGYLLERSHELNPSGKRVQLGTSRLGTPPDPDPPRWPIIDTRQPRNLPNQTNSCPIHPRPWAFRSSGGGVALVCVGAAAAACDPAQEWGF